MSKVREVIARVTAGGWVLDHTTGSHRQYKHPGKPGIVTIAGKPGEDMDPGTEASIYRQAKLRKPAKGEKSRNR